MSFLQVFEEHFSAGILKKFLGETYLVQQFLIFVLPVLPPGIDPYITLYSVTPYRRQVKIWLRIDKTNKVIAVTSSQVVF